MAAFRTKRAGWLRATFLLVALLTALSASTQGIHLGLCFCTDPVKAEADACCPSEAPATAAVGSITLLRSANHNLFTEPCVELQFGSHERPAKAVDRTHRDVPTTARPVWRRMSDREPVRANARVAANPADTPGGPATLLSTIRILI